MARMQVTAARVVFALALLSACRPTGAAGDFDGEAAQVLVRAGAPLIDVRTVEEFEAGHIEGAINLPVETFGARIDEVGKLVDGELARPIVVYCRSGRRSQIAKEQLETAGYTKVTNMGGIALWPQSSPD